MNKTKNKFYITEFYAVFVFVMAILVVAIAIYLPKSVKSPVVSPAPIPPIQKDIIVEKRDDGTKLVKNVKENFNVILPEGFGVNEKTYSSSNVLTFYGGEGETACKIEVYVIDNEDGLPLKDWVENKNDFMSRNSTVIESKIEKIEQGGLEYYKHIFESEEMGKSIMIFMEKNKKIMGMATYSENSICSESIDFIAQNLK